MPDRKVTKKSAGGTAPGRKKSELFSDEEMAAMKEAVRERRRSGDADGESDVLAKIEEMQGSDRAIAERFHALVKANAPALVAKTWYGMPAYANRDGKVICFFQSAQKFKARYATLGFQHDARLDEGSMWPTSWALTALTPADEKRVIALLKKAVRS